MEQHPERERQDAEEDPHVADRQQRDRQRRGDGDRAGDREDRLEAPDAELARQHRRRVGADGDEERVAERQQPGDAEQQVEPEQRDRVRDRRQDERHVVRLGHLREGREDGDGDDGSGDERAPASHRPHSIALPNSPAGRTTRTTITIR